MRGAKLIVVLGLLLTCTACSTVPFRATELVPTEPVTAEALIKGMWTSATGTYLVRQSALFEFQGMRMPMAGVMKLDTVRKAARVVGMNDMGVKLFELTVDRSGYDPHFIMAAMDRYPKFAEAVATSVRRMFLDPEPASEDRLTIRSDRYRLTRKRDGQSVEFIFGGPNRQLLEKSYSGSDQDWRVGYYEHQRQGPATVPRGIVLDDDRVGYRLTLWIESVEKTDE